MTVLSECIKDCDEDLIMLTFETIGLVAEMKSKLFNNHWTETMKYLCQVLLDKDVLDSTKESAIDVVYSISESKRVVLTKNPELMKQLIDTIF